MTSPVRDARPPRRLIDVLNRPLRLLLRTPAGRLIKPLALLQFTGRRTGRRFSVVVAWHQSSPPTVVTPATWRTNFAGGTPVTVYRCGRRQEMVGTLDDIPDSVAATMNDALQRGTSGAAFALHIPAGHRLTADDVTAMNRAVISFA